MRTLPYHHAWAARILGCCALAGAVLGAAVEAIRRA